MEKYRREFLVPYFRDVSALHLASLKLQEHLIALKRRKATLEREIPSAAMPDKPCYEAANGVFFLGVGIYLLLFSGAMFVFRLYFLGLFCILISMMAIVIGTIRYIQVSRENNRKKENYNRSLAQYQQIQKKNNLEREERAQVEYEIQECEAELQRVTGALNSAYRADVLPEQYRDMHTAVFLYIWLGSGRPNDLTMALKVLPDAQIKEKLDQFIANKGEALLKQSLQLAQKSGSRKLQKESADALTHKVKQLDASEEERSTYLTMIQSSIVTTTFFATASYIGQI